MEEQLQGKKDIDYSKIFNIRLWEGMQYKLATVLGITIKVISDDGLVNTEESNFNQFCNLIRDTDKGARKCSELKATAGEAKFIKCPGAGLTHYCASTYFYGKKFYIIVGVRKEEGYGAAQINEVAKEFGINKDELETAYKSLKTYSEESIVGLADLILDLFNIVIELSVQEYITQQANKEKEEDLAKMTALMEASIVINSTRNLKQLLKIIMQSAERVMQAEASSVFLIDAENNELFCEIATGPKENEVKKIRLKMGEGIAGWVAYTGAPLLVPDVAKDPRFAKRVDEKSQFITRSILCVPLKVRNQVIGVVQVLNKIGSESFQKSEIKFLEALASQAAIAIENTNLYGHLEERAEQLNVELKKANVNLGVEKQRIESTVQSMQDAVIAVDSENRLVMSNRIAEEIFSINFEKVTNKEISEFLDIPELVEDFRTTMREKTTLKVELKFMIGSKEHVFAAVFAPITDDSGGIAGTVAVFRDITEIKELDKMKSEFLNMVSHELRTPLTPIQAYSELMMMRTLDTDKIKNYSSIINKETQRLGALIGDLLDVSRIEAGKGLSLALEEVDFSEMLNQVYENFRTASAKHKITLTTPDKSEKIFIDRNKLIQVMTNLLSNAMKYSPDGGEINIIMEEKGDRYYVSVTDHGLGIPKESLPKIFDKFYRVENSTIRKIGGTGIGLAIVKYITELHNGGITVESEEGKGSKFIFYIPKVKPV